MKKTEREAISKKAMELGFKINFGGLNYELPYKLNNCIFLDNYDNELGIVNDKSSYCPIRQIESPEDLEMLFNAICPEKFRLPFS